MSRQPSPPAPAHPQSLSMQAKRRIEADAVGDSATAGPAGPLTMSNDIGN